MSAAVRFAGYAAIFRKRDSGGDTILPGAFKGSLERRLAEGLKLPLLWQHRPDQRIGWVESAGEDERGLRVVAKLDAADSAQARALRDGTVDGLSFGYRVLKGRALPGGRELDDLEIIEFTPTRPMQPLARVHYIESGPESSAA